MKHPNNRSNFVYNASFSEREISNLSLQKSGLKISHAGIKEFHFRNRIDSDDFVQSDKEIQELGMFEDPLPLISKPSKKKKGSKRRKIKRVDQSHRFLMLEVP